MKKLLFVDTNIYLDFYRFGNDVGMDLLKHLDSISDHIIVTYQVDMEFKNNRQKAILDAIKKVEYLSNIPRPGILSEDLTFKALSKNIQDANDNIKKLKNLLHGVLENPKQDDPVYKIVQKILKKNDDLNLTIKKKIKNQIRRQAIRRFFYGYPPRKKSDTSIGDAVNWEWICEIAKNKNSDVIIVSRDSDYGITLRDQTFINDWLKEEFNDRTTRNRKIRLTTKLSDALEEFQVLVSPEEVESEEKLITETEELRERSKYLSELVRRFVGKGEESQEDKKYLSELVRRFVEKGE